MKKTKFDTLFLLILSTILVACTNNPVTIIPNLAIKPTPVPIISEFQKGVAYTSWWHGEYSSPESDLTLTNVIKPLGVTWVSVIVTCYQDNIKSTAIHCLPDTKTPTDDDLVHLIKFIHAQGMKVMLKPHIDISSGESRWRGNIGFENDESAWQAWFASYAEFISHYAILAQANQVDYFVAGTELGKTSPRVDQWRTLIKKIRSLYSGPITYAANWGEVFDVNWWDDLDAIGVDAYYPLTDSNQPTASQLKEAWNPIVSRLGKLSQQWNRHIIVTEIGYRSIDGINQMADTTGTPVLDLQEQADCYQAMFNAFQGQKWWQGVYWWNWTIDPKQGGPANTDFTANNKPAENILRFYFGAPLRNLATPLP